MVLGLLSTGVGIGLVTSWEVYLANLRLRAEMPPLPVREEGGRVLIIAPHPDDETLGAGGLVQQALERGAEVFVVLMTTGDASEMALLYGGAVRRTPAEYRGLGLQRVRESAAALGVLGVSPDHLFSLGYPNGGLDLLYRTANWNVANPWRSPRTGASRSPYADSYQRGAAYCGEMVVADLSDVIRRVGPEVIVTSAAVDSHPDHWATWGFTRLAAARAGWLRGEEPEGIFGYLVHRADWPAPRRYRPHDTLRPPAALAHVPYLHWYTLSLAPDQIVVKADAVNCYRSQAPRWDLLLQSLVRANELFVRVDCAPTPGGSVFIHSPVGDTPRSRQRPGGDLAGVALRREGPEWRVTVTLAGKVEQRLTYAVLGHGLRGDQPFSWLLHLEDGYGVLSWAEAGSSGRVERPWNAEGKVLQSMIPERFLQGREVYVEAYAAAGPRYLDHTVTGCVPRGGRGGRVPVAP